ncbi:MAG: methyl-accepting chemotaxis protein [Bacillota bacterium]
MIVMIIVVVSVVGFFSYNTFKDSLLDISKKQLNIVTRQTAQSMSEIIKRNVSGMDLSDANPLSILMGAQTDLEQNLAATKNEIFAPLFEGNIYLTDSEGKVLMYERVTDDKEEKRDAEKQKDEDYSEKDYFKKILNDETSKMSHGSEGGLVQVSSSGYTSFNLDGEEWIGAYSKIAGLEWIVVVEARRAAIVSEAKKVGGLVITIAIIGVLLAAVVAVLFSKYLADPIKKVTSGMQRMADGDFSFNLDINRGDELGDLAGDFNQMVDQQSAMVDQIQEVISSLNDSGAVLESSLEDLTTGMESSLDEVNRMSASTQEVSASSEQVANMADETNKIVEEGNQAIQSVVSQMDQIKTTVKDSVDVIDNLDEKSAKIGEIVDLITAISEQTNLLALNAAIEAARAGEAGKGFAVVADEIRDLASQSAEAAEDIRGLVEETQNESDKAVKSIKKGTKEVQEGEKVINKAGKAFEGIKEATKETALQMDETSQATHELAEGSSRMAGVMDNLGEVSDSVAEIYEEVDQKSQQLEEIVSQFEV